MNIVQTDHDYVAVANHYDPKIPVVLMRTNNEDFAYEMFDKMMTAAEKWEHDFEVILFSGCKDARMISHRNDDDKVNEIFFEGAEVLLNYEGD